MSTDHHDAAQGGYVPDPEAETAALLDAFFAHLAKPELVPVMRARLAELEAANRHLIVDEPARSNVRMSLALVSAYEHLRPELGREAAIEAIRAAFVEPLSGTVRRATRAVLDRAPDPYRAMVELAKSREATSFGAGFEFRHTVDDDSRFEDDVVRCHYHQVLTANGAPELTPVLCAFDRNWIDAIDPDRDGFRFERETTIGTGGTYCPFHFIRTRRPQ